MDRVVILSQGRLVREGSVEELENESGVTVTVRSPEIEKLASLLDGHGEITRTGPDALRLRNIDAPSVGRAALQGGIELHELRSERSNLEDLFFRLTQGQYAAPAAGGPTPDGQMSGQVPPMGYGPQGQPPQGPPPGFPPGPPPGAPMPPAGPQQTQGGAR